MGTRNYTDHSIMANRVVFKFTGVNLASLLVDLNRSHLNLELSNETYSKFRMKLCHHVNSDTDHDIVMTMWNPDGSSLDDEALELQMRIFRPQNVPSWANNQNRHHQPILDRLQEMFNESQGEIHDDGKLHMFFTDSTPSCGDGQQEVWTWPNNYVSDDGSIEKQENNEDDADFAIGQQGLHETILALCAIILLN